MAAIQKRIEAGQPKGKRNTLRISGTGQICAVPSYEEYNRKDGSGEKLVFLKVKLACNKIRNNDDGSADQFTEFINLSVSGNRAKSFAKFLAEGQSVEFAGNFRTSSFQSDQYTNSAGQAATIYRVECQIGQDGWINVMSESKEGKPRRTATMPSETGAAAANTTPPQDASLDTVLLNLLAQKMGVNDIRSNLGNALLNNLANANTPKEEAPQEAQIPEIVEDETPF